MQIFPRLYCTVTVTKIIHLHMNSVEFRLLVDRSRVQAVKICRSASFTMEGLVKLRTCAAALALALGTTVGGMAHATTTFLLGVNGCSSSCVGSNTEIGRVDVTASGGALNFLVTLDNGAVFNSNG